MASDLPHGSAPPGVAPGPTATSEEILDYLDRRANRSPSPEESLDRLHQAMLHGFAEMHRRFDRLDALSGEIRASLLRIEAMFPFSQGEERE